MVLPRSNTNTDKEDSCERKSDLSTCFSELHIKQAQTAAPIAVAYSLKTDEKSDHIQVRKALFYKRLQRLDVIKTD